jgi:glycosyltransferase involved in cell wall biosynthesis
MQQSSPVTDASEFRPLAARAPASLSNFSLKGKRVAMVSFSAYPEDPRPHRAATALLEEAMNVDLICLVDDQSPKREVSGGLRIRRLAIKHRRGGALSYAYQYSAFILASAGILAMRSLRRRYDLVYIHNMPDILVLSALLPKALGAKVILDQHDPMPELMTTIFNLDKRSFGVRIIERLERWSIARANLVITVNVACKRIFANRSCRPEKIGIVMNSPDDKIFGAQPSHARQREASAKPFVIMYHGSIVKRNGLDLAVDALARIRQAIPFAELRIYGRSTPFLEKVMGEARSNGLADCVSYMGPRSLEQLVREIEACDLGIVPNHHSAFAEINTPTRIFEYLALGRPVIAPRASGITDYFDDRSLVFFDLGSAEDLARKIEFVYSHPIEVVEIVSRGQEVYRNHCWQTERGRLIEFVVGVLYGKGVEAIWQRNYEGAVSQRDGSHRKDVL